MDDLQDGSGAFPHITSPVYFECEKLDPFPLLSLPRELRDTIYEFMLVRKRIYVEACSAGKLFQRHGTSKLRKPIHSRSTWIRPVASPASKVTSYQDDRISNGADRLNLNLFLASKQIYREASPIYYSKNTFYFGNCRLNQVISIPTCLHFLKDRPPLALQNLTSIDLAIHSTAAMYHDQICCWTGNDQCLALVDLLHNTTKLRRLGLILYGWPPDVRSNPWDWRGVNSSENARRWITIIQRLKPLKELAINVSTNTTSHPAEPFNSDLRDHIGRLVAFVRYLRARLLKNGKEMGLKGIRVLHRDVTWGWDIDRVTHMTYVLCHDDEFGRSLLKPKKRLPLHKKSMGIENGDGRHHIRDDSVDDVQELEVYKLKPLACDLFDSIERLKYKESDDDNSVSLESIDFTGINLEYNRDSSKDYETQVNASKRL